ncbi:MAG: N-acetylmuramoyl-L-alanine amidase [Oscillospiraceae bacterium]|nr:N-acetylmuramoyl-L-alanine amidase [Oscillospiraceae bacterium]
MKITENFLTVNKFSRPGIKLEKVTKIAVHYVGNPGSSAMANRNYFENQKNGGKYVSAHFVIGLEGEIIQCIPTDEWSYCTNQANGYSISIECCHPDSTGKFNEKTEESLAELCAYLLKKFGLSSEDIIRHYDVTGKQCPLWWSPTKYQSAEVANGRFKAFKEIGKKLMEGGSDNFRYYVQVGAFSSRENAEKYLEKVRKDYPGAFIKTC